MFPRNYNSGTDEGGSLTVIKVKFGLLTCRTNISYWSPEHHCSIDLSSITSESNIQMSYKTGKEAKL